MAVRGKVIGVLEIINRRNGGAFTPDDLETLRLQAEAKGIQLEVSLPATLPPLPEMPAASGRWC